MQAIRAQILNGVAYHPTMLFIPVELAGMNIAFNVFFMMMGLVVLKIGPIIWLFTTVGIHVFIAIMHSRDAHLVTLIRARFDRRFKRSTRNFVPEEEGVKYVP